MFLAIHAHCIVKHTILVTVQPHSKYLLPEAKDESQKYPKYLWVHECYPIHGLLLAIEQIFDMTYFDGFQLDKQLHQNSFSQKSITAFTDAW